MITFPRDMPEKGAAGQEFEPQRVDFAAPEAGGRLGGVQAGFPLWIATWSLGRMGLDAADEWRAWYLTMRGSQKSFFGRDMGRPYPKRHPEGFARMVKADGTPFLGSGSGWSQAIDAEGNAVLTLQGLPPGLILSLCDYAGFKWDAAGAPAGSYGRRALARVVEGGMADATGSVSVKVEPAVPALVPPTAVVHLDRPACVMKLLPDTKIGAIDRSLAVRGGKIVALQDLRA